MYRNSRRRGSGWFLIPILTAAAVVGVLVGVSLYFAPLYRGPPLFYGWWFGWIFFIPVFFLIFLGVRLFFWRSWGWGYGWGWYGDPALEILRQRFARGELTKEQFEQMQRDLEQN